MATNDHNVVLTPCPSSKAAARLFCLPHAGGTASDYHTLSRVLPAQLELCAVELPGHGQRIREELISDVSELVPQLMAELRPWLDRPIAVFGHSLGATISFELCRALESEAIEVRHLFLSGCPAPHRPKVWPGIHHLTTDQFIKGLICYQGIPAGLFDNAELTEIFLPILRADFRMGETHQVSANSRVSCALSAFGGHADRVSYDDLAAWKQYSSSRFQVKQFRGHHFYLRNVVSELGGAIVQALC